IRPTGARTTADRGDRDPRASYPERGAAGRRVGVFYFDTCIGTRGAAWCAAVGLGYRRQCTTCHRDRGEPEAAPPREPPRHVAQHRRMVQEAHAYDTIVFAQVGIRGVWPLKQWRKLPRLSQLPEDLIWDMINAAIATSVRAAAAGYDAVDIQGNGAGAVSTFTSQVFNDREDHFGGTPERRLNFVLEIVKGIQRELGRDFPLFLRMHGG